MLKFFKKKKNIRIVLWITAIMIIPGFLIWGVGIKGERKDLYLAATVNKQPITKKDYYQRFGETEKKYREIFGDKYEEIAKNVNLEKNILDELIREKILLQETRKRRIKVLDTEIVEVVKSDPVFKDEKGKFNQEKFSGIINNYPPEELRKIENSVRKSILLQKLRQQIVTEGNIKVTDEEISEYIKKNKISEKIEMESIRKMLLWQKKEKYYTDWYNGVREKSKIAIYIQISEDTRKDTQKIQN